MRLGDAIRFGGEKFALFVGPEGVTRAVTTGATLEDMEAGMRLYQTLRHEIARFDEAVRRRCDERAAEERRGLDALLDGAVDDHETDHVTNERG